MKDGKKYILVADDDREIREIVSLLLSSEGYAVLTAEDGIQAAGWHPGRSTCTCWM